MAACQRNFHISFSSVRMTKRNSRFHMSAHQDRKYVFGLRCLTTLVVVVLLQLILLCIEDMTKYSCCCHFFRIHYSYLVPTSILCLHARYSMSKRCGENHSKCLSLRVFQLIFKHCETFQACNEYESTERQKVHLVKNL